MTDSSTQKRAQLLTGFILMAVLSSMASCTPIRSKPLSEVSEPPPSEGTNEVRVSKPYIFDVGDEVNIKVWGFDNLQKTAIINTSGDIYYPLLGRLKLAGKTLPQAQEMITASLKKYLVDPQVDVTSTTGRQQIYVVGEVNTSGMIPYTRPLKVTEALARAGWFNQAANKSNVLLVRRADGRFNVYRLDAGKFLQDGNLEPQFYLQPGDLIYVPPKTITKVARYMQDISNILQPFMTAEQMVILWPQLKTALQGGQGGLSISTPSPSPPSSGN
jgi:protein involved in polysaccharide export with SLBB domain